MSDIFHGINGCLNFPMSMSCPSVILNSLTHQDFVPRSLSLLDAAGRFVELAKLQAWSAAQVAAFRADVKYAVLLLDRRVAEAPSTLRNEMRSVATVASEMMSYGRR